MERMRALFTYPAFNAACIIFMLLAFGVTACDSGGSNDEPDPEPQFDRAEMLTNIASNGIVPAYQAFLADVNALHTSGEAFLTNPSTINLEEAQIALRAARLSWQRVALFQFGPAETFAIRGVLNTYPTDEDQIAQNIASGTYILGSVDNLDAGGFPALDYLFHGVADSPESIIAHYTTNADAAGWRTYMQDNLGFVQENTEGVVNGWLPSNGNYLATFLSSENGGTDVGSSLGQLLNAMILHYERFIRDGKIGIPAGIRSSGVPRPRATEAFYGGYSAELAVESMRALIALYEGTTFDGNSGIGIVENLQALDATPLATDISTSATTALSSVEALSDPLSSQIESDLDEVVAAFTNMQQLVVLLKADMTSILGVTITFQDNDGD